MTQLSRPPLLTSGLIRLLSRDGREWNDLSHTSAAWLAHQVTWREAIGLSSAVGTVGVVRSAGEARAPALHSELLRTRQRLIRPLEVRLPDATLTDDSPVSRVASTVAAYRESYLARQHEMDTAIGSLRQQVRAALSGTSARRLAALDEVMEATLRPQERRFLSTASPGYLARQITHLHSPESTLLSDSAETEQAQQRERLSQAASDLLREELEFRLQPTQGLLAALRKVEEA